MFQKVRVKEEGRSLSQGEKIPWTDENMFQNRAS